MASPEQLHKPCLCAAGSAGFQKYLMGACKPKLKEFFWKNVFKSWLGTVELVSVRTGFEPPQLRWTLNWTLGPVQQKCWTLNWTSVRFSKVQVRTSVLDWTSATLTRENITVVVSIAADGSSIPPAVIFKGQAFLPQWKQDNPLNAS